MKNVYNNKELCHIWANEKQESARGSNMFFENGIIYSYGRHFPIAKIYHNKRGKFILLTKHDYSSTTAKHISYVTRAISDPLSIVDCVDIGDTTFQNRQYHHQNLNDLLSRANEFILKAKHARQRSSYLLDCARNDIDHYQRYIEFFNPSLLAVHKKAIDQIKKGTFIPSSIIEKCSLNDIKARELEAKREARQIEEEKEDLKAWLDGEDKRRYFTVTALRIKDGYIETSKGARVTLQAGKLLYAMIQAGKDIKGYNIEGYTVISINGTLKIGCHEIPIAEVHRIGALLI